MTSERNSAKSGLASVLANDLRLAFRGLKRRLREQADLGDMTWPQTLALMRLERDGPATVTALAHAEGMRPQSMGANIAALQSAGFISGEPDPNDGRQTIWSVTPACRDWIEAGRAARQDWLSRTIETKFTPLEQEELARAILLLNRLIES